MPFLHVKEKRPRDRIGAVCNRIEVGRDAIDLRAVHFVGILLEKAVTEDAESAWIGLELLHDQVVVFPCLDVATVFPDRVTGGEIVFTRERRNPRERLAASFHRELEE